MIDYELIKLVILLGLVSTILRPANGGAWPNFRRAGANIVMTTLVVGWVCPPLLDIVESNVSRDLPEGWRLIATYGMGLAPRPALYFLSEIPIIISKRFKK